jgi:hypothetical protein
MTTQQNKYISLSSGIIGSYGLLQTQHNKIDPYTRSLIGITIGASMFISQNSLFRFLGVGIVIGSALQILDIDKGGKLSFNKSNTSVYVLPEQRIGGNIKEYNNNEIPKFNIDGFTIKGLNGVFKLSDGIYAGLYSDNTIGYSFGIGGIVNKIRNAGIKDKSWCEIQIVKGDERWIKLYEKSI